MGTEINQQSRSAFQIVDEVARGAVSVRMTDALREVARSVIDTGKKGKIVLTLNLSPSDVDNNAITIDAKVAKSAPEMDLKSLFFTDDAGNITRDDPRQTKAF